MTRYSVWHVEMGQLSLTSLQDGQESAVVNGSEMVISREAYSDNSSKYKVDGKKKTRAEVEQLLASKGIDLENNRFLILQVSIAPTRLSNRASRIRLMVGRS